MYNLDPNILYSLGALASAIFGFILSRLITARASHRQQFEIDQQTIAITQQTQTLDQLNAGIDTLEQQLGVSEKALALSQQNSESLQQQLNAAEQGNADLTGKLEQQRGEVTQQARRISSLEATLVSEQENLAQRESELATANAELKRINSANYELSNQNTKLLTSQQEKAEHFAQQLALFNEQKEALKQEFENISNKIFEEKGKSFSHQNQQSMDALLNPFKQQLEAFRKRVDEVHTSQTQEQATLKSELKQLHELNQRITAEASNLTRALKNDKKVQGNWGEIQVEMILDQSGLKKGREYMREENRKDDERKNWRPDFVVYLPEGKQVIIDSKVSLNAYTDYVAADDEQERERFLKKHALAVHAHIDALSQKDYSALPGINSPDFVFMFMPVESAFIAAFEYDQSLLNKAFEKRIVVVTPTTLLATLRTIANLWSIERQNQSAMTLAGQAGKVYDKLRVFVEKMDKLGNQIATVHKTYDDAHSTLTGSRSLTSTVQKFVDLGVRVKQSMPESVIESAIIDDGVIELGAANHPLLVENL